MSRDEQLRFFAQGNLGSCRSAIELRPLNLLIKSISYMSLESRFPTWDSVPFRWQWGGFDGTPATLPTIARMMSPDQGGCVGPGGPTLMTKSQAVSSDIRKYHVTRKPHPSAMAHANGR